MNKKQIVLIIIIVVFLFLNIFGYVLVIKKVNIFNLTKKNQTGTTLYECYSKSDSKVVALDGFDISLFSSPLNEYKSYTQGVKTDTRAFSFKDFEEKGKNLKEDLWLHIERKDNENFSKATCRLEICNMDNKTISPNYTPKKEHLSEDISGLTCYLRGSTKPKEEGKYRVDGYIYMNDKWNLVGKEFIEFTK